MKQKSLILISILLVLCIGSLNLTMSYDASARVERQKMVKDFSPSSFITDPIVASGGNDSNYVRALSINSEYYESVPAAAKTLDFTSIYEGQIHNVEYGFYGLGGSGILKVWNGASWASLKTITSETWYNGTYALTSYYAENVTFALTGYISCDYMEVRLNITLKYWYVVGNATLEFFTPDWNIIATGIIGFVTPLYMWAIESFLIVLGLVMIPTSTLYLVRGGRSEISTDKLFFGLILFFMGWALLLGGIMS